MRRTSREICWTRCEIAQPCCGPSAKVFRIRRSSVPCGRSIRALSMIGVAPLCFYGEEYAAFHIEAQGEKRRVSGLREVREYCEHRVQDPKRLREQQKQPSEKALSAELAQTQDDSNEIEHISHIGAHKGGHG